MHRTTNLKADAALVLTALIWGSTFVMAKDVLTFWPPLGYLAARFTLAAGVLVLLFRRDILAANRSAWFAGLTLGGLIATGFGVQAIGQVYTTASRSAFITGLTTPLVPLVAFALLRVRPTAGNMIGVMLASIGGWLFLDPRGGADVGAGVNIGDVLTLACTSIFALHITLISFYSTRFSTRQLTVLPIIVAAGLSVVVWFAVRLLVNTFGTHPLLPQFVINESTPLIWTWRVTLQLLYLAVIATVLTFLLWTWGQTRLTATRAAIIFSLEPVFATLFAVAVRGRSEWLGTRGIIGAVLIILAVVVSELRLSRKRISRDRTIEHEGGLNERSAVLTETRMS